MVIPQLDFVSDDRMVAYGDSEIAIFEGTQKPKLAQEIPLTGEAKSIFNNFIIIGTTSKLPTSLLVEINKSTAVTIDDMVEAIATPKTPYIFDNVMLKITFTITPITPFIVVTLVFCIENNEEFNIGRKFKNNVIQKYKEHFLR